MTRHRPPLSPHEVIVARIRERIVALVSPTTTLHTQWLLRPPWMRLRPYPHVVEHPSLIDQLRAGTSASTAGASGGGPGSKPPANITALNELGIITAESRRWAKYAWGIETADCVEALGVLSDRASTIEHLDDLKDLDAHVTRWWAHARVTTTWDSPPFKPYGPCPACGKIGGLRVTDEPRAAVCLGCSEAWDASTIYQLGDQVSMMLEPPASIEDIDPDHDAVAALDDYEERLAAAPSILQGVTFKA